jgi:cytochrome c556
MAKSSSSRGVSLATIVLLIFSVMLISLASLSAQKSGGKPGQRARLPKFDNGKEKGVFFENIFEKLVGPRVVNDTPTVVENTNPGSPGGDDPGGIAGSGWAEIISPEVIENEIKAIKVKVDSDVDTPSDFKGRGYKRARRHFTVLAIMFAVIGEYDGDVRFQEYAPAARELFAKAARNCKAGSTPTYNEAKLRKADLQDLVGGGGIEAPGKFEKAAKWATVCDRSPLMQRLEFAIQQTLQPMTADKSEFLAQGEAILHEAEMVAVMAEVLCKAGMEDADDETYTGFAQQMKKSARNIVDAVKLKNDEAARKAVGEINKACSNCHEDYRG